MWTIISTLYLNLEVVTCLAANQDGHVGNQKIKFQKKKKKKKNETFQSLHVFFLYITS